MKWNELSMADRAEYIKWGVNNGLSRIDDIRKIYNEYAGGGYKGNEEENKINYYNPITGENYGDTMPEGMVKVNSFSELTPEAQDEYMKNHPITLDDFTITAKPTFKDTIQGIFSKENWDDHKGELKETMSYFPVIGDAVDVYDIGKSVYNKDYSKAGILAASLLLPNVIDAGKHLFSNIIIDAAQTKWGAKIADATINRKAVKRAKEEGRYIPDMTPQQYKDYLENLYNVYNNKTKVDGITRYEKRLNMLQDNYLNLTNQKTQMESIPIEFSRIEKLRKRGILDRHDNGVNIGDRIYVGLQKPGVINVLNPISYTQGIAAHELEHTAQDLLGYHRALQLTPLYTRKLGYDPNSDIIERLPLTKWGTPVDNKGRRVDTDYYGILEDNLKYGSTVFTNPKNGFLFMGEGVFNGLTKNNYNYLWESAPIELGSELAKYLSKSKYADKLFFELPIEYKTKISEKLSDRFNTEGMLDILNEASKKGYLKYGGQMD